MSDLSQYRDYNDLYQSIFATIPNTTFGDGESTGYDVFRFRDGTQGYAQIMRGTNGFYADSGEYIAPSNDSILNIFEGTKNSSQIYALGGNPDGSIGRFNGFTPDNAGIVGGFLKNPAVLIIAAAVGGEFLLAQGGAGTIGGDALVSGATDAAIPGLGADVSAFQTLDAVDGAFSATTAAQSTAATDSLLQAAAVNVIDPTIPTITITGTAAPAGIGSGISANTFAGFAALGASSLMQPGYIDPASLLNDIPAQAYDLPTPPPVNPASLLQGATVTGNGSLLDGLNSGLTTLGKALGLSGALSRKPVTPANPSRIYMMTPQEQTTQAVAPSPVGRDNANRLSDFFGNMDTKQLLLLIALAGVAYYAVKKHGAA